MYVYHNNKRYKVKALKDGTLSLDLSHKKIFRITDIKGLEQITNLSILNLDRNNIQKIEGIEALGNLNTLILSNNQINEISGLESLTNLKKLNLAHNNLKEIKGLNSLINLNELNLWHNQISEIKGLTNLNNLKIISLSGNPVYEWVRRTFGSYQHLARDLVIYCKKLTGEIVFDATEFNKFLSEKRRTINEEISKGAYKSAMSLISDVFYAARTEDRTLFYDFIGNLLKSYPSLKNDPNFKKEYDFRLRLLLSKDQRYEMDHYLYNKYFSSKVKPAVGNFCPNCGTKLESNWKVCPQCGTHMDETEEHTTPSYIEAPRSVPPDILKTMHPQSSSDRTNGFGIASIILAIIGCCCSWCVSIVAIILAIVGFSEDDEPTLSVIGLILGICGLCGGLLPLLMIFGLTLS